MNKLKEIRLQSKENLTLDNVASATGINRATLSRYENGNTEPKMGALKKLSEFYGVSVAELMGVDDYMKSFVETMQKFDSKYEDDLETQLDRLSKSKYKSFELPIITNALDLILTTDEKYFDQDDINIDLSSVITNLNSLIHNTNDEFNVNNPEFGKEEDTYKAISDTFTELLDKIKAQNKKASDDKPETEG